MRKIVWIILVCMVLCCCNGHRTKSCNRTKDSVEAKPWLDTLDINIETILLNMGMYREDYRKYGIKGFTMPKDTAYRNSHKSEIYPGELSDIEWAIYHVKRIVFTDSMLRIMAENPLRMFRYKVRTDEQHPDTVVNHVYMHFIP